TLAVTCGMDAECNRQAVDWLAEGKLRLAPLLTHIFKPEQAAKAYEMMRTRPGDFLGVAFDWREGRGGQAGPRGLHKLFHRGQGDCQCGVRYPRSQEDTLLDRASRYYPWHGLGGSHRRCSCRRQSRRADFLFPRERIGAGKA